MIWSEALYGIVPVWSIIGLNLFMLSTDKSLFVSVEVSILAGWLDSDSISSPYLMFSVPERLENSVFVTRIIVKTLNINKQRTAAAKSISLHTIKRLIKYSLKRVLCKGSVYFYRFRDISVQSRSGRKGLIMANLFGSNFVLILFKKKHFVCFLLSTFKFPFRAWW